ncbi:MAG: long-chain fatty acid--CoA ligase [Microcystaceae cyanobacterium]
MTKLVDYSFAHSLPEIWPTTVERFADLIALYDPHSKPEIKLTYRELWQNIQQFAAGLTALGVKESDKICLFSDNSPRWFIADQGIMTAGAANAVRSSQADKAELLYILTDSDSSTLIVENNKTYQKLKESLADTSLERIIILSDETPDETQSIKCLNFTQLMDLGKNAPLNPVKATKDTLATLIYTSGTTGKPKGAMLSQGNLLHQLTTLETIIQTESSDPVLSILPSWHAYERSAEYFLLSQGCMLIYTSIRTFKNDLKQFKPRHMIGVPRLCESLYEGIQKNFREQPESKQKLVKFFLDISERYVTARRIARNLSMDHLHASSSERLMAKVQALILYPLHALGDKLVYSKIREATGGQIQTFVSGGGSLARHLDSFYEIVGVPLVVGYGLTETSPVATARTVKRNFIGSSGRPISQTEIRIVDSDTKQTLPPEKRGLVLIRGPQVMQGYYKKPEATAKAIDPEKWFDSGDLGWLTKQNDLILTGRAKDTIVLSNGENIEPQPIEDACLRSAYIDQIMLVGQDQKALGALIVPNVEALEKWVSSNNLSLTFPESVNSHTALQQSDLYHKSVIDLFKKELKREVQNRPGYRPDDQIKMFEFVLDNFSMENGMMTQTLKVKRPVVTQHYQEIIQGMFE